MRFVNFLFLALVGTITLSGCDNLARVPYIDSAPVLTRIENPLAQADYRPLNTPMPAAVPPMYKPNSLWRSGARAFFKDQRAARVGDILTVLININDKAKLENLTERERDNEEIANFNAFFGVQANLNKFFPAVPDPEQIVDLDSQSETFSEGAVDRKEEVVVKIAAMIIQILPNGNFVIEGHQEVRVDNELRDLFVKGIIRPQDVTNENDIDLKKIAEARVGYGGRGVISDIQRPRYGQEFYDIFFPY